MPKRSRCLKGVDLSSCNHYWIPIYYPPERLPRLGPLPVLDVWRTDAYFGPQSVPQRGVEEAIARTKAKYPKTMAALADTHDNASDVSVTQGTTGGQR